MMMMNFLLLSGCELLSSDVFVVPSFSLFLINVGVFICFVPELI